MRAMGSWSLHSLRYDGYGGVGYYILYVARTMGTLSLHSLTSEGYRELVITLSTL